jgi:hypothetical protein
MNLTPSTQRRRDAGIAFRKRSLRLGVSASKTEELEAGSSKLAALSSKLEAGSRKLTTI